MTQNGVQSSSIGRMFLIELGAVFCFSAVFAVFFEVKIGLSVLLGAIAYLQPYGLAYLVCFGKMPGCVSLLSKVPDIQKKSHAAGGFIAAELIKILLTAIIFLLIFYGYREANWSVLLLSFGAAIGFNWVAMLWMLRPDTKV